jgi:hypothetical protein
MPAETPILDNFNRADGAVGSNWTTTSGLSALTIVSNTVTSASGHADAYWNPSIFNSPLEIYASIPVWNHEFDLSYCLTNPGALATRNGYTLSAFVGQGSLNLYRVDAGVNTDIGGFLGDPVNGDIFRVRLVNGVHTLYKNDVEMAQINDSTYTTGYFALHIGNAVDRFDDFGGGPLFEMTHVLMPPRIYG